MERNIGENVHSEGKQTFEFGLHYTVVIIDLRIQPDDWRLKTLQGGGLGQFIDCI